MNTLVYFTFVVMIHAFLVTPFLMGCAFDRKRHRDERGRLNFKRDSLILRHLYCSCDIWTFLGIDEKEMPSNICQLYWGIFWGTLRFPFVLILVTIGQIFNVALFFLIMFLGFWPKEVKSDEKHLFRFGTAHIYFHRYKRFGESKNEKLLFAPWEIVLPLLSLWLLDKLIQNADSITRNFVEQADELKKLGIFLCIPLGIVVVAVGMAFLLNVIDRHIAVPAREFIRAKKTKACFEISVR